MSMREEKLKFWQAKGKDVLFVGASGVGKTMMVRDYMASNGLSFDTNVAQWSTPLLDFVGCKLEDADVLLFDDFNDEKSYQAAKELLSLRQWKAKSIKPSTVVWACHTLLWDEKEKDYTIAVDVDAFTVQVRLPNMINRNYFQTKFGEITADIAIEWFGDLFRNDPATGRLVSPRRLEQALDMWVAKGDIRDVLPIIANVSVLMRKLNSGPLIAKLKDITGQDDETKRTFLSNESNFNETFSTICGSDTLLKALLPHVGNRLTALFFHPEFGDKVIQHAVKEAKNVPFFRHTLTDVLKAEISTRLSKKIRRALTDSD